MTRATRSLLRWSLAAGALLALLPEAFAQASPITINAIPGAGGATQYSVPVQTLLFLTALGFLPALLLLSLIHI